MAISGADNYIIEQIPEKIFVDKTENYSAYVLSGTGQNTKQKVFYAGVTFNANVRPAFATGQMYTTHAEAEADARTMLENKEKVFAEGYARYVRNMKELIEEIPE